MFDTPSSDSGLQGETAGSAWRSDQCSDELKWIVCVRTPKTVISALHWALKSCESDDFLKYSTAATKDGEKMTYIFIVSW